MRDHWAKEKDRKIKSLEQEIARLKFAPQMERFANEVGNNIMLVLANTPFEKWPEVAKTAFHYAKERQETTAHFYKENLPKGKANV